MKANTGDLVITAFNKNGKKFIESEYIKRILASKKERIEYANSRINSAFYENICISDLVQTGKEKCTGVEFDYRSLLKRILVKQRGQWGGEYYAPNKAALRKILYGRIEEMTYLDNDR